MQPARPKDASKQDNSKKRVRRGTRPQDTRLDWTGLPWTGRVHKSKKRKAAARRLEKNIQKTRRPVSQSAASRSASQGAGERTPSQIIKSASQQTTDRQNDKGEKTAKTKEVTDDHSRSISIIILT